MCKIAGFWLKPGVRAPDLGGPLQRAPSSLRALSREEPHGHGLAWVDGNDEVHRARGFGAAYRDSSFDAHVNEAQGARALAGHVRWATQGVPSEVNTHPFGSGDVSLVQNGSIPGFQKLRPKVMELINPELRSQIRGDTDTEAAFWLYQSHLGAVARDARHPEAPEAAKALGQTMEVLARMSNPGAEYPAAMNFIVLTPELMVASRYNRALSFSDTFGVRESGEPLEHGAKAKGLAVATKPWHAGLNWQEVPERAVVAMDLDSKLYVQPAGEEKHLPLGPMPPRTPPEVPER